MKTSELIELLNKIDPTGEANISILDGTPYKIEKDNTTNENPYIYLDENQNLIVTNKGLNIDLYFLDIKSFVRENFNDGWDGIKKKIKFDLDYSTLEKTNLTMGMTLKSAREHFEAYNRLHNETIPTEQTNNEFSNIKKKKVGLFAKNMMRR